MTDVLRFSKDELFDLIDQLARYWPQQCRTLKNNFNDVVVNQSLPLVIPPAMVWIALPDPIADLGVSGKLLAPKKFVLSEIKDYFALAFWYLQSVAERQYEEHNGSIHSYQWRLKNWPRDLWNYAWVNRIALMIRRLIAQQLHVDEINFFGPLPRAEIFITHDVDAICKTIPIRLKQAAFNLFNFFKSGSLKKLINAWNFLFSSVSYDGIAKIIVLEEKQGVRSLFNIYGGQPRLTTWLLDPSYQVTTPAFIVQVQQLLAKQCQIGLHQSFSAWQDTTQILAEKICVEQAIGISLRTCRQHWLRFSFADTWRAQSQAGFELDLTLGFNDQAGFRNGAALLFKPWDFNKHSVMTLSALPMVLMDSHLYDYHADPEYITMTRIIDEVIAVGGQASVIWHPHVLNKDYGWQPGFEKLLEKVAGYHAIF